MPLGDLPLVALLAEEPVAHIVSPLPPLERVTTERYCVNLGATPTETVVQGVRCDAAGLGDLIAEVRSLVLDRGHRQAIWFMGPSSRPPNLLARLRQAGFVPTTTPPWEPIYAAMIMTEPPTPPGDKDNSNQVIIWSTCAAVVAGSACGLRACPVPV